MRNQEQNEHPVLGRYPLYFKLTFAVFAAITLIWAALAYLLWPGLHRLGLPIAYGVEVLLGIFPLLCWIMWGSMLLASTNHWRIHPIWLRISNRWLYAFFPLVILAGLQG